MSLTITSLKYMTEYIDCITVVLYVILQWILAKYFASRANEFSWSFINMVAFTKIYFLYREKKSKNKESALPAGKSESAKDRSVVIIVISNEDGFAHLPPLQ